MFSKNKSLAKTTPPAAKAKSSQSQTTLISGDTVIEGDITFSGTIHLEGRVTGNVTAEDGLLTIAHNGRVDGDIRAPRIVVDGHICGNVYADQHLELAARAVITGNVFYSVIEMAQGSQVNGSLEYHPDGVPDVRPLLEKAQDLPAFPPEGELLDG